MKRYPQRASRRASGDILTLRRRSPRTEDRRGAATLGSAPCRYRATRRPRPPGSRPAAFSISGPCPGPAWSATWCRTSTRMVEGLVVRRHVDSKFGMSANSIAVLGDLPVDALAGSPRPSRGLRRRRPAATSRPGCRRRARQQLVGAVAEEVGQHRERRVGVLGGLEDAERVGVERRRWSCRCTTGIAAMFQSSPGLVAVDAVGRPEVVRRSSRPCRRRTGSRRVEVGRRGTGPGHDDVVLPDAVVAELPAPLPRRRGSARSCRRSPTSEPAPK